MRTYYKIFEIVESRIISRDSEPTKVLQEAVVGFNQFDTLEEAEKYMDQRLSEYVDYTIIKVYRVDN